MDNSATKVQISIGTMVGLLSGVIGGLFLSNVTDSKLNASELKTAGLTSYTGIPIQDSLEVFADPDMQKIIAEQDPAYREALIELVATHPKSARLISNLQAFEKQYGSIAEAARTRFLELNPELMGTGTVQPKPEATVPNAAEIEQNR